MADQFVPTASPLAGGQNLLLNIGPGTAITGSLLTNFGTSTLLLPANATSYVYFDCLTRVVTFNSTGFTRSTIYPIAIAVTNSNDIVTLTDVRGAIYVYGVH